MVQHSHRLHYILQRAAHTPFSVTGEVAPVEVEEGGVGMVKGASDKWCNRLEGFGGEGGRSDGCGGERRGGERKSDGEEGKKDE